MYNLIKKIYPLINDDDFDLQDNSDGEGIFISRWSYTEPIPSKEQLEAVDLHPIAEVRSELMLKIDADIDEIYKQVVGNRLSEYQQAAAEAQAFKDVNYIGLAGSCVTAWATIKMNTPKWAADEILTAAATLRSAQSQMRFARLNHKENARKANNKAQIESVNTSWEATLSAIKAALGIA